MRSSVEKLSSVASDSHNYKDDQQDNEDSYEGGFHGILLIYAYAYICKSLAFSQRNV